MLAAPTIGSELDAPGADLHLVIAGYAIPYPVLPLTCARPRGLDRPGLVPLGAAVSQFTAALR